MRPKTKNTNIFFTHRQQKIPRTKPQKRKNKQQQQNKHHYCCFFIAFASTIQFSHNTPPQQTTPTNQQPGILPTRGDLQNNTRAALDTQQHATKQNKPSQTKHKHTHPCFTDPPTRAYNHVRYLSSPANKNLPPA